LAAYGRQAADELFIGPLSNAFFLEAATDSARNARVENP
jgi:hypothetical protein